MNPRSSLASSTMGRRRFLQLGSLAAAAPLILPAKLRGAAAPSKLIHVAIIGTGNIAEGHLKTLLGYPERVRIVAVCDVDRERRDRAAALVDAAYGSRGCSSVNDFREVTRRADVDAVWVCTPDHWHALIALDAIRHGKDAYVEKPLTFTIEEGRALVSAAREHGRVVQHGTQHRSMKRFFDAAGYVRSGGLGKLERIEVAIPPNNRFIGSSWTPEPVPATLDWDLWLGPTPWRPYHSAGCHYNFRFIADCANGQVANWGAHYLDIGQWALNADDSGPIAVEGHGHFPTSGLFTCATHVDFTCHYANGIPMSCRTRQEGGGTVRFIGERGWIDIARNAMSASSPDLLREMQRPGKSVTLTRSDNHHENFLDCIRSRARPVADVEIGHRTTTVCNLGQIAMTLGRKLRWDPVTESFPDDPVANRLRGRAARSPWSLV